MYDIDEFEAYTLRKSLGNEPVLAWNLENGYHFLSSLERMMATANGEIFKIVGVLK